jgi:predicted nucleic acid-binding protein
MPLGKPIVVLDSNVVFSALFSSKGYSFELLKFLRVGAFQIALTPPLLFEYEDLLFRPGKIPHLSSDEMDAFLGWLTHIAESLVILALDPFKFISQYLES